MSQQDFINKVAPGAIECYKKYKVLPSLTIAQAILESGWGKTKLAIGANNLFGIKAFSDWKGDKVCMQTAEYKPDGTKYYIDAWFRKYNSFTESIFDHAVFLQKSRYKKVLSAVDYKTVCKEIQAAGYATDPNYSNLLIDLIERYKLYSYDKLNEDKKEESDNMADNKQPSVTTFSNGCSMTLTDDGRMLFRSPNGKAYLDVNDSGVYAWNNGKSVKLV